jgi:hypothetical protein
LSADGMLDRMLAGREGRPLTNMAAKKRTPVTCNDCYFRQEGLCALPGNVPCPTFRAMTSGTLAPPQQPRLVPRVLQPARVGHAA